MFCSNCGKELIDGSKFCSNCGAAVGAPLAVANQNNGISDSDIQKAAKLRDKAKNQLEIENYDKVLDLCAESIELNPEDDVTWFFAGVAAQANEDYDNAIKYFSNSIALDDNDAIGYFYRGQVYYQLEDYENALEDFNDAIRLNHSEADLFNMRGNTYCCLNDLQHAISDYGKALKLRPNDKTIKSNLANVQEAVEAAERGDGSAAGDIIRGIGSFLGGVAVEFLSALSDDDDDDD
jgi:tetratricopeptide (TPR) repeat protein